MAEQSPKHWEVHALADTDAGVCMAKIVKTNILQARTFAYSSPGLRKIDQWLSFDLSLYDVWVACVGGEYL